MSLRILAKSGRCGVDKKIERIYMKNVFEIIANKGGGFLLPLGYVGCDHQWKQLDAGFCVCSECGKEHHCYMGECPEIVASHSERICSITGCVTVEGELMAERSACERTGAHSSGEGSFKNHKSAASRVLFLFGGGSKLRDVVESTVREILASDKTEQCMIQEEKRSDSKLSALFSNALREASHDHKCERHNMILLLSQVEYHCRKNRRVSLRRGIDIGNIIEKCTESITSLLLHFGGIRVTKQMQNVSRCREFICSILYLMRMGITYQNRQLLPKMDILNNILPLQVLLPVVFKIRAKSITEGENIIKLDIRQMPLI
jgi:hypothetical protein